jgi:hypothetical protein
MNNKKVTAKELLKNKAAMARLRDERAFQNVMTRKTNMTKAGNKPAPKMLAFVKAKAVATAANKPAAKNTSKKPAAKNTSKKPAAKNNSKNNLSKSMHAYKHYMAIPFAKTGLHNVSSPGYHEELVRNMKNMANRNKTLVPMHNKNWFVDQLKRNVWALRNNQPVQMTAATPVTAKGRAKCVATKTKKLLANRTGKATAKPKALTSKQLLAQLKAIKPVK